MKRLLLPHVAILAWNLFVTGNAKCPTIVRNPNAPWFAKILTARHLSNQIVANVTLASLDLVHPSSLKKLSKIPNVVIANENAFNSKILIMLIINKSYK